MGETFWRKSICTQKLGNLKGGSNEMVFAFIIWLENLSQKGA